MKIMVSYRAVDGYQEARLFEAVEDAMSYAQFWVGASPDRTSTYAVSGDGVGRITAEGVALDALFSRPVPTVGTVSGLGTPVERPCDFCGAPSVEGDSYCAFCVREVGTKEERDAEDARYQAEIDGTLAPQGAPQATQGPKSFKVAVKTKGDQDWSYNGMRYATSWAAEAAAADLASRWFAVTAWEVHPSDDEPNA